MSHPKPCHEPPHRRLDDLPHDLQLLHVTTGHTPSRTLAEQSAQATLASPADGAPSSPLQHDPGVVRIKRQVQTVVARMRMADLTLLGVIDRPRRERARPVLLKSGYTQAQVLRVGAAQVPEEGSQSRTEIWKSLVVFLNEVEDGGEEGEGDGPESQAAGEEMLEEKEDGS